MSVAAFKKGPDYIDAGWLGLAAGSDCYNLDSFLFNNEVLSGSFARRAQGKHLAVVEGNRGVFDGVDATGGFSTAELAKLLDAPVILVIDAAKMTRTAAALVVGCQVLDPALKLSGVILNRVGGARHERVLREAVEGASNVPVIGSVGKLPLRNFPQRHLGLLPWNEHPAAMGFVQEAARVVQESVDLDKVIAIAQSVGAFPRTIGDQTAPILGEERASGLRIGVIRDSAFHFYYPENLEALGKGAKVVLVSALEDRQLPDFDALYIGGGFPETHAERLADNSLFKQSLRRAVLGGLPVYAECGGLMYLSDALLIDGNEYPMAGVLPVSTVLEKRPQGHGYGRVEVCAQNPFYPVGTVLTGHEFHYSRMVGLEQSGLPCAFRVLRGQGLDGFQDGVCTGNVLAAYLHVHSLGTPEWARGIIERAKDYNRHRNSPAAGCASDATGDRRSG